MRRILACLIASLLMTSAAHAAPRPLMELGFNEDVALAGDRVLFTQTRANTVEVRALPLAGGPPETVFAAALSAGTAPDFVGLTASAQRAVLWVAYDTSRGGGWHQTQFFAGTPTGGWSAVTPMRDAAHPPIADDAYLEDGRIIAHESFGEDDPGQVVTYDPDRQVLDGIEWGDRLSGDLVLSTEASSFPGGVHATRLRVVNRRTGLQLTDVRIADQPDERELRPDGRIVYVRGRTIYEVPPGADAPRRLVADGRHPTFSGERMVFVREDGPRVREPGGRIRAFGIPTRDASAPLADAANVLWRANGCVLVAAITDAPASEPGPGPCARSEFLVTSGNLKSGRIRLKCVAGPAAGCRARIQLRANQRAASTSAAVRIPPGKSRWVRVKLTRAAKRLEGGEFDVRATLPDGRRVMVQLA